MAIAYAEGRTPIEYAFAQEAAETLVDAYPNHSWNVRCDGGVLLVKHFSIHGTIGMCLHMDKIDHDAGKRKHSTIMAAGELLERAGLARRAYDGTPVTKLEGDEKFLRKWKPQPASPVHHDTKLIIEE